MIYYPIFLNLEGKAVLIVGGGKVAQRKIETLLECGALVRLAARELTPALEKLKAEPRVTYLGAEFREEQLNDVFMVIAATDNAGLNQKISQAARVRGLLVNAVDQPADCNFIVPSVLRRGGLQIAVSTSGQSPILAKKIREALEPEFGEEYERLIRLMGRIRAAVLNRGFAQETHQRIFEQLAESDLLQVLAKKEWAAAAKLIDRIVPLNWSAEEIEQYSTIQS
ncbi:MAG: bifunctional precorrin-2 dehydrogenase/sirohydrochlorin ferrochelatase [Desulfobacteraceae bacterium]|nr:MAG: bifunctional precorrin-2 dehydrogenase/sirohydrochlorin ferrochelatase [Desulfobacteraceae bacterium]